MRTPRKRRVANIIFPVGSLMAIGEIMLVLWITSIIAGMATQIQMSEEPLAAAGERASTAPAFDHTVIVGPGKGLSLDDRSLPVEDIIGVIQQKPEAQVALRAVAGVDAGFFFNCRYRLREAGIGYCEQPPKEVSRATETTGGVR